jgi:3'-phosphoadenosine 5'-phosphosulfate sulfotransferase (PAPS reductase)/FAD synthetase
MMDKVAILRNESREEMKYIASVSFGKDSLAMLLWLIYKKYPLDEVVFFDTGMEFQAIYDTRDKVLPLLKEKGIKYTELKPKEPFLYKMFEKEVHKRDGSIGYGYSWCGGRCRWGTTEKLRALEKYCKGHYEYVGLGVDEPKRLERERNGNKLFPLAEWHMTENDCLKYCYDNGFEWKENGIRLYDILDRVSCWCCGNKNLKELRNIYLYLPEYWERLKELQSKTFRPMKGEGKSIFDLEERFGDIKKISDM